MNTNPRYIYLLVCLFLVISLSSLADDTLISVIDAANLRANPNYMQYFRLVALGLNIAGVVSLFRMRKKLFVDCKSSVLAFVFMLMIGIGASWFSLSLIKPDW